METDYLIVGQGIAGTNLAHTFLQHGKKIGIIDQESEHTSSKAAAGICNPITGKRLANTWMGQELFPFLHHYYRELEKKLGEKIIYPKEVYRIFHTVEEQNRLFSENTQREKGNFMNLEPENSKYSELIDNPLGGWETRHACYIDTEVLLKSSSEYFKSLGIYQKSIFEHKEIQFEEDHVVYQGIRAKKIIFCEGTRVLGNEYFSWVPVQSVKGEWIEIETKEVNLDNIINQGIFILPLGKGTWKIGATYNWEDQGPEVSQKARHELLNKLDAFFKLPYQVTDQKAGNRPASQDRRPIIGFHPEKKQLLIFNGLGTKGLSLSPYFAAHLFQSIENGAELMQEVDIKRFMKYFPSARVKNS